VVKELSFKDLTIVLRHCPISEYFACKRRMLCQDKVSKERARYLVIRMMSFGEDLYGLCALSEHGSESERSESVKSVKSMKVIEVKQ